MRPLIAIFLITLSLTTLASELQIFDLRHRTAEELIPILKPMMEEGAAITGTGYTLIVRSNKTTKSQIAQLLKRLDQAPDQLLITVEQNGEHQRSRTGVGISGNSQEHRIEAGIYSNRSNTTGHSARQLRVLTGSWATIRTGRAVPQVVHQHHHSASGSRMEQRIEYRDVDSGFEVRPRINGNQVTLDIRPFRAQMSGSGRIIEQQSITTTISGRLGHWIEIGAVTEAGQQSRSGIAYSSAAQTNNSHTVRLMIERIHD